MRSARGASGFLRHVGSHEYKGFAGDADDALVGAAGCAGRELAGKGRGDVFADNGEITVFKLEDVGASAQAGRLRAACVRVGSDSAQCCHDHRLEPVAVIVKRWVEARMRNGES